MLKNTYIHIPGIGIITEQRIWECGIRSWEDFLEKHGSIKSSKTRKQLWLSEVEESIEQLNCKNQAFFAQRLPPSYHWRGFQDFKEKTAYVDIETTGLSPKSDCITIIGIYNGKDTKTYVKGINLEEAPVELAKYKQLVTFNGARFDLPFIKNEFPGLFFNHLHIDLLFFLKKLGYSGGLKKIEGMLGLKRNKEISGLTGFDAVILWEKYERGNKKALDLLIKYNSEDVLNLEKIIEMMFPNMINKERERLQGHES
jgi:uncharacterized protein YprB with RNaseH-like and TPR domain